MCAMKGSYTHTHTHCNTWCPAEAVRPPSPVPRPSGSISAPARSSARTHTHTDQGWSKTSTKSFADEYQTVRVPVDSPLGHLSHTGRPSPGHSVPQGYPAGGTRQQPIREEQHSSQSERSNTAANQMGGPALHILLQSALLILLVKFD